MGHRLKIGGRKMHIKNNLDSLVGARARISGLKEMLESTTRSIDETNISMQEFWNDDMYNRDSEMLSDMTRNIKGNVDTLDEYLSEIDRLIAVLEQYGV